MSSAISTPTRRFVEGSGIVLGVVLLAYSALSVWQNLFGTMQHYTIFTVMVLVYAAIYLLGREDNPAGSQGRLVDRISGALILAGSGGSGTYLTANAETLEIMQPFVSPAALAAGGILITTVLLSVWRIWGTAIALICLSLTLYMIFGRYLPDILEARMPPFNVAITFLSGIGGPRGVLSYAPLSADMIFMLLVYGGVLHAVGVIGIFGDIGALIGNKMRGGMAYSAVLASTLVGMVTGQAVSNIALSGVITIPAMKKSNFSASEAASVEIMASTGSQLLPPIMGLGAFMMAVILGISYFDVVLAGLIPGLLYMAAILASVAAMIGGHKRLERVRQEVDLSRIYWITPSFLLSFSTLIVLLVLRYSPAMAGFWGCAIALGISVLRPKHLRPSFKDIAGGFKIGVDTAVQLAVILAAIGLVVQTLTTTGLGISAGELISDLGQGNLFLTLLIGMFVCLIVGMGLPTPAAYSLIAIIVVPSLIDAGITPMAANMFGFYFAIFSALTPPVAVGILVGARIAKADFLRTAFESGKMGFAALGLPFMFVSFPELLQSQSLTLQAVLIALSYAASAILLSGAIYGHLFKSVEPLERVILATFAIGSCAVMAVTGWYAFGLVSIATLVAIAVTRLRKHTHSLA
ncbi:hypothetical protein B0E33_09915 [Roseibium algicola]|uniref:TRAP C4-dicarboxylate transport system permease DctM subunit domain-containing protein n=1 Tax=Roseibium algicola TaxID=2857014 RepID=A0ABM6I0L5_9HYPH|nr:TRAP transporter fused permease subunit [Roseibium aggregatum]AQQ03865.1 hypothetical protein B0E33_09915 [Roseibium aggregatum]